MQWWLDLALGMGLGFVGGLFGIGGGLIAIPVLAIGFGLDQQLAQGTAMLMILSNVLVAIRRYAAYHRIEPREALLMGASSMGFAWSASLLALWISAAALAKAFALFLMVLAGYLAWQLLRPGAPKPGAILPEAIQPGASRSGAPQPGPAVSRCWLGLVGALGGVLSGLFGVGGGVVAPPILTRWFGKSQTQAQGLALCSVVPGAVIGLATYALHQRVDWWLGLPLSLGGLFTVPAGVRLAHRLPERQLRLMFCGLMLLTGTTLLLR
ncbi:sulfite exporter TauE/SafE family protein [Chitinivorax sp. PXF-14]|uniref:sulfite exporter TauE/SafE family protein n=1 Tax=Chitinivorax sp. PXF-14 TaxID=3230488 RepID=UPI0034652E70